MNQTVDLCLINELNEKTDVSLYYYYYVFLKSMAIVLNNCKNKNELRNEKRKFNLNLKSIKKQKMKIPKKKQIK